MKYFIWRLLGQCFWIRRTSHYRAEGVGFYSEYEQRKKETRNCCIYRLIRKPKGGMEKCQS